MNTQPDKAPQSLAEAIDAIESAYELMLAYAAQGRAREEGDPMGVRRSLANAIAGIDLIDAATPASMGSPAGQAADALAALLEVVRQDGARARAAFNFVLAQISIGSQLVDNLNASIHVRALLTDLFLIDAALGVSGVE